MLDFSDVGEIGVYIDEDYVVRCEQQYRDGGLVPGRQLAHAFATLRANELIWHFHVNNYLKGTTPAAFDLLFWNGDSSNLPGPLYAWYLRNMYLENNLRTPARVNVLGSPVDLARIRHRPTCSPPVRTISCRGPLPMRRTACLAVESSSCSERAVMWQA